MWGVTVTYITIPALHGPLRMCVVRACVCVCVNHAPVPADARVCS